VATACYTCRAGYYCKAGAAAAYPCWAGRYSSATELSSAAECTLTDPGYFSTTGSTEQTQCAAGTIAPTSQHGVCVKCAVGRFQPAQGTTACLDCTAGSHCGEKGLATSLLCPEGLLAHTLLRYAHP
jgi:hypothetical protein